MKTTISYSPLLAAVAGGSAFCHGLMQIGGELLPKEVVVVFAVFCSKKRKKEGEAKQR